MVTLSLPVSLLVAYFILLPIYIGIAGWSFKFHSLKANSSSEEIEGFQRQLRFPTNRIFRENSIILMRVLGKNFINSNLSHARSQRMLNLIMLCVFHNPILIGMLSRNNFFDVLYLAIFLFTSITTIIVCMRFGHSLVNNASSQ